ncbi:MAG TPA: TetR/AcrR family transcriptional regulator [Myxococcota bacterium]|jgi:AcrR family transcriptional regulator
MASHTARKIARKMPKQERARATRDALLDAAALVLVDEGYDGASTNKIAARAGVSVGSLYQYFDGKDQIVTAVAERHHEQLMAVVALAAADPGEPDGDLATLVEAIIGAMLQAHAVDPELHRVLTDQIPHNVVVRRIEEDGATFVRGLIELHKARLRQDLDVDVATFIVTHAVEGVTHAAVIERPGTLKGALLTRELARMVTRFLGA